ncbi:ATP:cob(I)alamin adenosyltransferase [Candidatus Woesebacteria bacterium RIFCSPHIGHO2_12_FULL_44_11]|uniref:Corrinoid adenosyltransferase n=1 Tax=Candidatus Woesebacteria bacterium RIFCSPLOWO2_01_FULL_44_14 TaxID=1802525 RepID=A0A1F8C062_9BACT|nr:MAG: ATP:cob(I)alamin adenosyltransferase [Candidatus Woesebacteria bacterium RIFCSPHIGHO2_12_FULL_44_11]OGM69751.1 MAG: ATP:cob(I)alamin adenosyltransferase [Candidatus Woesebacteria bacterium RIFCSPLOWO2_01_FULL_44_14]
MPVYTKKGDKGTTGLFASTKQTWTIPKNSPRIRAIGGIDEINSFLGLCAAFIENQSVLEIVFEIQRDLFTIGSILAGAPLTFSASKVKKLEGKIDSMESVLPKLSNFILPGGSRAGALLHTARVVTRRAERELSHLAGREKVNAQIVKYVNRLSDFLFTLARKVNFDLGTPEKIWKSR